MAGLLVVTLLLLKKANDFENSLPVKFFQQETCQQKKKRLAAFMPLSAFALTHNLNYVELLFERIFPHLFEPAQI